MRVCLLASIAVVTLTTGQSLRLDDVNSSEESVDDASLSEALGNNASERSLKTDDESSSLQLLKRPSSEKPRMKRCLTLAGTYRIRLAGETVDDSFTIHQTGCMGTASGKNLKGGWEFSIEDNALKDGKRGILGMVQANGDIVLDDNAIAEKQEQTPSAPSLHHRSVLEKPIDEEPPETSKEIAWNPSSMKKFCWKSNYDRGIGSVPPNCPDGYEKHGLLCFEPCPSGSERTWASGFSCITKCPKGWSEQAWQCRKSEYSRGAGYSYWNRDACPRENPHGCEWHGSTYYPKCKSGYEAVGCCMCRPTSFKCNDFGNFASQTDISCGKQIHGKMFPSFGLCGPQLEMQGGMCYKPCKPGHDAVGPMCWSRPPVGSGDTRKNWVNCGMGAAESVAACTTMFPKILGPVQIVADIATYGEASVAFKDATGESHAGLIGAAISNLTGLTVHTSRTLQLVKRELVAAIKKIEKFSAEIETADDHERPAAVARTHRLIHLEQIAQEATSTEEMVAVAVAALALYNPLDSLTSVFTQPSCSSIDTSS